MKSEESMTTKTRRQYTDEFKAEAVRLVRDSTRPVTQERWLRLFGQVLSIHKWRLVVNAYAAVGRAGRVSQYTRSGVRPSSARCGLS
ncbi:MAG: hypothetical protein MRJ68_13045 [Nitrospira sp.]|nr:hypothetical protein [Nitrospira sp.]